MKSDVAVDRVLEIARQLDDRAGRTTLSYTGEACRQQPMTRAIGNRVHRASESTHRSGYDIALLAVDHDFDTEVPQKRMPRPACCGRDADAAHLRELHEQPSHTTTRAVHENGFARPERETVEQLERRRA